MTELKALATQILATGRDFLDWRQTFGYAQRAADVLPLLAQTRARNPEDALALGLHALRRAWAAMEQADDSGGDIGGLLRRVLAQSMLTATSPYGAELKLVEEICGLLDATRRLAWPGWPACGQSSRPSATSWRGSRPGDDPFAGAGLLGTHADLSVDKCHNQSLILYKLAKLYRMRSKMPAKAPPIGEVLATRLQALGERIRAHRERQKVSATVAAESAGMSRVTLHRIERGEPSVTMGAYLSVIDAVGLQLELRDPQARPATADIVSLPERVRLAEFPQLKGLAWQLHDVDELSPADALNLYERNWRHIDRARMEPAERALLQALVDRLAGGRLLV